MSTENVPQEPRSLSERLSAAQAGLGRIHRDGRNDKQSYDFTSIHAIADATRAALAAEGLALVPTGVEILSDDEVTTSGGSTGYRVVVRQSWLLIAGGESVGLQSVGEAIDYGDKAANKATTFARKNLLILLLNLSTGDDDPDSASPEAAPRKRTVRKAPESTRPPVKDEAAARLKALVALGAEVGISEADIGDISLGAVREAAKKAGQDADGFDWPGVLIVDEAHKAAQVAVAKALHEAKA